MVKEIFLRFVIFLEVAAAVGAVFAFINYGFHRGYLISAALFISFTYFVFHIPLRKHIKKSGE